MIPEHIRRRLRCPACRLGAIQIVEDTDAFACTVCDAKFPSAQGRPILFDPTNALFAAKDYLAASRAARGSSRGLARWIPSPSVNLAQVAVLGRLRTTLDARGTCDVLVVGGGQQRSSLDPQVRSPIAHHVVYTDVDASADVDLFCDGHDLPFADDSFDAVITTAVLEHVLYPERVAAEITRVLKPDGLLYSELPFMQQVHEGAYDFTRYTLSGHRRLFNRFTEIDSGMVAGPATTLVWAIENFALAFVKRSSLRSAAKAGVRIFFGWLKHFDRMLAHRPEAMDGASCTYFFGAKTGHAVEDIEIIHRYVGAKPLRHS